MIGDFPVNQLQHPLVKAGLVQAYLYDLNFRDCFSGGNVHCSRGDFIPPVNHIDLLYKYPLEFRSHGEVFIELLLRYSPVEYRTFW
ncbi:MAG: hypothetical protein A4E54_01391 [Pelotomaculum sp. PtaB.Bin117]|nr:MAG: hypothetical protein A4E54_01391 [Pelotomaculum sp. PtaB.Bin117]